MVRFRLAPLAALLIFFRAAARCLVVVIVPRLSYFEISVVISREQLRILPHHYVRVTPDFRTVGKE